MAIRSAPEADGPILAYDLADACRCPIPSAATGRIVESAGEAEDLTMIITMTRAAGAATEGSASLMREVRREIADV